MTSVHRLCLILLVLVAGLAAYGPKAVEKSQVADFERYYTAGRVALTGGDIYAAQGDKEFKYFPVFAQSMMPVAYFGSFYGAWIWYGILCASYLASIGLAVHMMRPAGGRVALWMGGAAILLSGRFFVANVRNGQINMVVMFLAVLGCWCLLRKREWLAGVAVGAGAAIKFMPIVLLLWMIRQKRWRAATATVATVLVCLFVLPAATWGVRGNWELLHGYIRIRHKMVTGLPKSQAAGQSLPSMTNRLLRPVNASTLQNRDENDRVRRIYIYIADLSPRAAKTVALVLVLIMVAAVLRSLGGTASGPGLRGGLEVGVMFLLMLLISPEARRAHFVTVLVPAAALTAWLISTTAPRWLWGGMTTAFALLALSSSGLLGKTMFYFYLNAYGVVMWGAVVLFVASLEGLRQVSPDLPGESAHGVVPTVVPADDQC